MKQIWLAALLLGALAGNAQVGGSTTYQFLNSIASARVAGQGGNAIANVSDDLNFALYNPALLSEAMDGQFTTSGVSYVSDVLYGDAAYAQHFDSLGTFYGQVVFLDFGEIDRTDELGVKQGTFKAADYAINVGYGYELDSNWQFGAKLQYVSSQLDSYFSQGIALDGGITYQIPQKRIAISLLAKNAGFQFNPYHQERESLPFEVQLAISNRFEHLPLRWQISYEQLQRWDLRYDNPAEATFNQFTGEVEDNFPSVWNNLLRHLAIGAEFAPTESFNLQFGYNFRRRQEMNLTTRRTSAGFSFGGGIKVYNFRIQYSRNMYHVAGTANHVTISTDFHSFKKKDKKREAND